MPADVAVSPVRHEDFCLPRPGQERPRIEKFTAYADDPGTGRSRPTHIVTRCCECGASAYNPIGA